MSSRGTRYASARVRSTCFAYESGNLRPSGNGGIAKKPRTTQVVNMLYLESPAGSGDSSGYSECIKGGKAVACSWDDVSQAEAYAHSLAAFKEAFPEYAGNDLYLTGESCRQTASDCATYCPACPCHPG